MDPSHEKLYWDEQIPSKNDHEFYAFPKEQVSAEDGIRAREALKRRQRRGLERSIIRTTAELDEFHFSFANQVDGAYLEMPKDHYYVTCSGTNFLKENSRAFAEKMTRLRKMIAENQSEQTATAPSSTPSNTLNLDTIYRSKLEDIYDGEFDHIYTSALQTMENAQICYAEDVKNIGDEVELLRSSESSSTASTTDNTAPPGSSTPPGPSTPPGQPSSPVLSSIPIQRTGSRDPRLNPRAPSDPRRR
ncbi:hypothetical protein K492DRAFT_236881 [Lichtheimia hyalospora FSU 10163]|nr:hypothetical protein K492DRAFT_236881 [Lichtheimia hyalospora FSU 10163]